MDSHSVYDGNATLINLASLQGVPTELYEAASIDGAGGLRQLWSVTIPMVKVDVDTREVCDRVVELEVERLFNRKLRYSFVNLLHDASSLR